jgi:hypothetical protein
MFRTTLILAAALVAPACSCSDARCNAANCTNMILNCRVEFGSEPNVEFRLCLDAGPQPANYDGTTYCPAACNATPNGGSIIQCLAQHPECNGLTDGGQDEALSARAPAGDGGTGNVDCHNNCDSQRTACDVPCFSKSGYQACMDCAASCGLSWEACDKQCQ